MTLYISGPKLVIAFTQIYICVYIQINICFYSHLPMYSYSILFCIYIFFCICLYIFFVVILLFVFISYEFIFTFIFSLIFAFLQLIWRLYHYLFILKHKYPPSLEETLSNWSLSLVRTSARERHRHQTLQSLVLFTLRLEHLLLSYNEINYSQMGNQSIHYFERKFHRDLVIYFNCFMRRGNKSFYFRDLTLG